MCLDILFLCYDLPFDSLFVIRSATGWTQAIHIIFDVVEAELADLKG
jgi:hypothetical protein